MKVIVVGEGHLEYLESVGINVFERVLLLILDYFLESADVLGTLDLDREDVPGIITENYAVETYVMHDMYRWEKQKYTGVRGRGLSLTSMAMKKTIITPTCGTASAPGIDDD
jgi:hypothetical protein